MRKQFVNKIINYSKYFIIFFFIIYFFNFYINQEKKIKVYFVLNYGNFYFLENIQKLCQDLKILQKDIFSKQCENIQVDVSDLINFDDIIIQNIKKKFNQINLNSLNNNLSDVAFRWMPSFYSYSEKQIRSLEFFYNIDANYDKQKLEKKIHLAVNQVFQNFFENKKKIFFNLDKVKNLKKKYIIDELIDIGTNNNYFPNHSLLEFNLSLIDNSYDYFYIHYGIEFKTEDQQKLNEIRKQLDDLKIKSVDDYNRLYKYYLAKLYNRMFLDKNNLYSIYVLSK